MTTRNVNGFPRRRNNFGNNIRRIVTSKIRALEINHSPKWIRSRSLNKDPASYNASMPVSRKLRFVTTTATSSTVTLSSAEIAAIIPSDSGFTVERFKIFGPAGDNQLTVGIEGYNGSSAQTFDDYGTPGHERQCVDIFFPRTGLIPIGPSGLATDLLSVNLFNSTGTRVAGQVIVDVWITANWSIPTNFFS
jgi:hypothetical protein